MTHFLSFFRFGTNTLMGFDLILISKECNLKLFCIKTFECDTCDMCNIVQQYRNAVRKNEF